MQLRRCANRLLHKNMRVVVDTNVLASGLFFGGQPNKVLSLIVDQNITPCFTPTTLVELERVLCYNKFERQRNMLSFSVEDFMTELQSYCALFPEPPHMPTIIHADPSDDAFLTCAVISNAKCIISGDKHLLQLKNFAGRPILTPAKFLADFR